MDPPRTPPKHTKPLPEETNRTTGTPQWCKAPKQRTTAPKTTSTIAQLKQSLTEKLALKFMPEDWQAHLIRCMLDSYDAIFCTGTGYGKSLIFEGLASLGGKNKLVLVVCPLKSLEYDQVCSYNSKTISLCWCCCDLGQISFCQRHWSYRNQWGHHENHQTIDQGPKICCACVPLTRDGTFW